MTEPDRPRSRADYERGLPDHHDPTAGLLGAPPAQSALTLRLVLAVFGVVVSALGGIGWLRTDLPDWPAYVLFAIAVIALVDIVVILRRKRRGEPG